MGGTRSGSRAGSPRRRVRPRGHRRRTSRPAGRRSDPSRSSGPSRRVAGVGSPASRRPTQGPSMIAWCAISGAAARQAPAADADRLPCCRTCTSTDHARGQGSRRRLGGGGTCARCGAFWLIQARVCSARRSRATRNDDRRVQGAGRVAPGTGTTIGRVQEGRAGVPPARRGTPVGGSRGRARRARRRTLSRPAPIGAAWRAAATPGRRTPRTPCRRRRSSRRPPASGRGRAPPRRRAPSRAAS